MNTIIKNADIEYMSMNLETYNSLRDLISRLFDNIINTAEFQLAEASPKDYLCDPKSAMSMPWTIAGISPNIFMPYSTVKVDGETLLDRDNFISQISDNSEKSKPQFVADDMEFIAKRLKEIQKEKENGVSVVPPSAPTIAPTSIY